MSTHLSKEDILTILRRDLPALREEYGIERLAIYGSFARDQSSDDSDIDILVDLNKPLGLAFIRLVYRLEQDLGREVDLTTFSSLARTIEGGRQVHIAREIERSLIYV